MDAMQPSIPVIAGYHTVTALHQAKGCRAAPRHSHAALQNFRLPEIDWPVPVSPCAIAVINHDQGVVAGTRYTQNGTTDSGNKAESVLLIRASYRK